MNKQLKQFCCSIIVLCVAFFSQAAAAKAFSQEYKENSKSREEIIDTIVKDLHLNAQQEQLIAAQREQEKKGSLELREKMKTLRVELSQELEKKNTDKTKVYSLIAEMKELIGKRIEKKVEGILSLKEILTPEQFKLLNSKIEEVKAQKRR